MPQFKAHKVIYRRYAGLFFVLCVDVTDNELAYLESVHLFVEILDHYFNNVCELDLVFNFHKVCGGAKSVGDISDARNKPVAVQLMHFALRVSGIRFDYRRLLCAECGEHLLSTCRKSGLARAMTRRAAL